MQSIQPDNISDFINHLKIASLGGIASQYKLAPEFRQAYNLEQIKKKRPNLAGVAIILFKDQSRLKLILTKRADYSGHHSAQVSFPGGKQDIKDKKLIDTAIRETYEEIGINLNYSIFIRQLTDLYIPVSNFLVSPFLFFLPEKPRLTLNYEVESVLLPPWPEFISDDSILIKNTGTFQGKKIKSPGIIYESEFIWGATAMILSEFYDLTQKFHK